MNCLKEYMKYVSLNVLGMIGLSCYILADTFFVANGLGSDGLAALNLAIPVYSFIHGTGLMLGIGGATRYSMARSRGDTNDGNRVFSHTVCLGICFGVLFVFLGLSASDYITDLLGADNQVFSMCRTYLKMLLLFSPAFLTNDIVLCFVRNDGAPQLAMAAMLAGSFSNIVLDYVFILLMDLGIFGAVSATGLAPVISLMVLIPFFIQKKNQFHLCKCTVTMRLLGYIFTSGAPSLVAELSSGIVMIVFNIVMLRICGNIGVAAYGVIANLSLVVIAVYTGIAQGIQPLLSSCFGTDDRESIRIIFRYAVITVLGLSALIYGVLFFGANQIAGFFNSEQNMQMQKIAVEGIRLYFTACIFAGYNIVLAIYFTSTNQVMKGNAVSLLRGFVLIIPMAVVMAAIGGMDGLWLAFPATEAAVSLTGAVLYFREKGLLPNSP